MSEMSQQGVVATPEPPRKPSRSLSSAGARRLILIGAWTCAVLAVVGGSTAFGWWLATNTVIASQPNPGPTLIEVPVGSFSAGDTQMPDVRGLTPDVALQVLADAGIDVASVSVEARPAAGESDRILEQSPVFGTPDPAEVQLVVSSPAAIPTLEGLNVTDATNLLIELGARVDRITVYEPDAPVDIVRSSEPAAGGPLPERVVLTVTAAPSSVYLSQLQRSGSCSSPSSMTMDGKTYSFALECSATSSGREASWQLNKAVDVVKGIVGVVDSADPGSTARVQILGDGVELAAFDVAYGDTHEIELRTTGVLRLTMLTSTGSSSTVDVGLGDVTALGASAPLAGLARR